MTVSGEKQTVAVAPPVRPASRYALLDQLRAIGALCVVWSHLAGSWLTWYQHPWAPLDAVRTVVTEPLSLRNDLGSFGVALFFLVSGFVITHAGFRENGRQFLIRRMLRIYPPLFFAVALMWLIIAVGLPGEGADAGVGTWLRVATLTSWMWAPASLVLPVTWTLFIEVVFYLIVWACLPFSRRVPLAVPGVVFALTAVLIAGNAVWPPGLVIATHQLALLPVLGFGQLAYLAVTRRVPLVVALAGGLAGAAVLEFALLTTRSSAPGHVSWMPSVVLAVLVFLIALACEGRVRGSRVLAVIARRSYSLYLLHWPVGMTTLTVLNQSVGLPYTASLAIALLATALVTEISYRFIERPWIDWSRRIA